MTARLSYMPAHLRSLSTSDWAVLAFLSEGAVHGFKLAAIFAKGGELGTVWTLQRPQVYRAVQHLQARLYVSAVKREPGENGPPRTLYALTALGRATFETWLTTPVQHLRDGRSDLLLKLIFTERHKLDAKPLLRAQLEHFSEVLTAIQAKLENAQGPERTALEWRIDAARGALAFLERKLRLLSTLP